MEQTPQLDQVAEGLRDAVMQAAINDAEDSAGIPKIGEKKVRGVSPLTGAPVPQGRQKGTPNKLTRTIREAVEAATKPGGCHPDGLAGWLIERAQGGLGDRQIFAAMVSKAMPLQVQANVDGGIKIQLGWLGQRQIGTTTAQNQEARPQSIDLQQETDGTYRIIDQPTQPAGAGEGVAASQAGADGQPGPTDQNGPEGAQGA